MQLKGGVYMFKFKFASGAAVAVGALFACSIDAQTDQTTAQSRQIVADAAPQPLDHFLVDNIVKNQDRALADAKRLLFELDSEGVLTAERAGQSLAYEAALRRSKFLQQFYLSDLDGSLSVEREEVSIVSTFKPPAHRFNMFERFDEIDTNRDGSASYSEVVTFENQQYEEPSNRSRLGKLTAAHLLNFDEDGDGKVTEVEVASGFTEIAEDPQNIAYANNPRLRQREQEEAKQCLLPAANEGDQIVLISGYEGSAVSPIAVTGVESETTVMHLEIEPGRKPLYIVAFSLEAAIWKVTGATERVSHFAAQKRRNTDEDFAGVGVVGLPEDRVSFVDKCGEWFEKAEDGKATVAAGRLASKLGRPTDTILGSYTVGGLQVPSGEDSMEGPKPVQTAFLHMGSGDDLYIDNEGNALAWSEWMDRNFKAPPTPEGVDEDTWKKLYRSNRDGVAEFELADVVAPAPVIAYDILSNEAGLVQLLQEGALERTRDGYYRLLRDIPHFPAGLGGGHKADFLIAPGVERPSGGGHSSIFMEETGKCVTRDCFR